MVYFDEILYFAAVFFAAFTFYAPVVGASVLLWRSAEYGSAVYVFLSQMHGEALVYDSAAFASLVISTASLILLLIMTTASVMHAGTLKYAVCDLRTILTFPETRSFIRVFLFVSGVVFLLLCVRISALTLLS